MDCQPGNVRLNMAKILCAIVVITIHDVARCFCNSPTVWVRTFKSLNGGVHVVKRCVLK